MASAALPPRLWRSQSPVRIAWSSVILPSSLSPAIPVTPSPRSSIPPAKGACGSSGWRCCETASFSYRYVDEGHKAARARALPSRPPVRLAARAAVLSRSEQSRLCRSCRDHPQSARPPILRHQRRDIAHAHRDLRGLRRGRYACRDRLCLATRAGEPVAPTRLPDSTTPETHRQRTRASRLWSVLSINMQRPLSARRLAWLLEP